MNKRTRKRRMAVRQGRRGGKMTEVLMDALKEHNAAAELSEKMRGVHPLGQMCISVLAKIAGQPGADLLMAEAVQELVSAPTQAKASDEVVQLRAALEASERKHRHWVNAACVSDSVIDDMCERAGEAYDQHEDSPLASHLDNALQSIEQLRRERDAALGELAELKGTNAR